jgi:predicted acyl esterase
MRKKILWILILAGAGFCFAIQNGPNQRVHSQGRGGSLTPEMIARRNSLEKELQSVAIVERKLMVPMRDGKRMAADVYRPKDQSKKYPVIFVRTPYNFNFWDVRNGLPRDMTNELEAVKRGYVFVQMNERGHFFSEGNYDILGPPLTDGDDAFTWMAKQPWSNGKVGTIGCSSTAEWQLAAAAQGNLAYAAMIPQGFGAGVGRVGPYYEQGNWYRGGAVQMLFIAWLYGEQNQVRPMFSPNTSREDLIRASKSFHLAQQLPRVDWSQALRHLPVMDIMKAVDGPKGIFAARNFNPNSMACLEIVARGHRLERHSIHLPRLQPYQRLIISVPVPQPLDRLVKVVGPPVRNFPRFDRNMNTGGKNYDESKGVVAHNVVHHSRQYPSEVKLTVIRK